MFGHGELNDDKQITEGMGVTNLVRAGAIKAVEDAKAKMEAIKTDKLVPGGGLNFDKALAPIGASGLAPGAGDTINNNGNNRNTNMQMTNYTTINGNNESAGATEGRYRRAHADIYRNSRVRAA